MNTEAKEELKDCPFCELVPQRKRDYFVLSHDPKCFLKDVVLIPENSVQSIQWNTRPSQGKREWEEELSKFLHKYKEHLDLGQSCRECRHLAKAICSIMPKGDQ